MPKRKKSSAGILEQSTGARNRVGIGLSYRPAGLHRLEDRYYNSVPTCFLAHIDCYKIPALGSIPAFTDTVESEGLQMKHCRR
jgi:hypothetical protein